MATIHSPSEAPPGRALVVHPDDGTAEILIEALSLSGLDPSRVKTAEQAIGVLEFEAFEIMITDMHIPGVRGRALFEQARELDSDMAVLLLAGAQDVPMAVRCLRQGAYDYILQPFDIQDVAVRSARAIDHRNLKLADRSRRVELERRVKEQGDRLLELLQQTFQTLTQALEAKDLFTRDHSERVAKLSGRIARHLYPGDPDFADRIELAARFHDIGKIGISELVLKHPGPLTESMLAEVRKHTLLGESIISPLITDRDILAAVRSHHERMDGAGYPDGLKGGDIPLSARIVAVADGFDALISARSYRDACTVERAIQIMKAGAGTQWDPEVVDAAIELILDPQA